MRRAVYLMVGISPRSNRLSLWNKELQVTRTSTSRLAPLLALWIGAVALLADAAKGQFYLATQSNLAAREKEYDALGRDVAALEQQLGIYKRVAKLVTPSVGQPMRFLEAL